MPYKDWRITEYEGYDENDLLSKMADNKLRLEMLTDIGFCEGDKNMQNKSNRYYADIWYKTKYGEEEKIVSYRENEEDNMVNEIEKSGGTILMVHKHYPQTVLQKEEKKYNMENIEEFFEQIDEEVKEIVIDMPPRHGKRYIQEIFKRFKK